jgi:Reverse transcriptase (RNA-dependent DNA polymerase)
MMTTQKTKSLKSKTFSNHHVYTTSIVSTDAKPTCYSQAIKHAHWCQTMADELTALAINATWDLVPLPSDAHTVGCKWLFKVKKKADGSIERYKARLVAKGYTREEGFDYFVIFSHVIKPTTIRVVLSTALSNHWQMH